jgi:abortive infection bacteriophage resistance protein
LSKAKIAFSKPALTVEDQVKLLIERGLVIDDVNRAQTYVGFIGYYRLSGYYRYFADYSDGKLEKFRDGITFDRVLALYIFDRKLRSLLSDALERIEVAVKATTSNAACLAAGPNWLCDPANFDHGRHNEILDILREALSPKGEKHKHIFLTHFFEKYSDSHPPGWMIMEALSFGSFSKIYKLAKGALRSPAADAFGVHQTVLESWLHALVFARNLCAHHSRIWNRKLTITPKIPKRYRGEWPEDSQEKLYIVCCIIHHMLSVLADDTGWANRLKELIQHRPDVPLKAMGFPEGWESSAFWKSP